MTGIRVSCCSTSRSRSPRSACSSARSPARPTFRRRCSASGRRTDARATPAQAIEAYKRYLGCLARRLRRARRAPPDARAGEPARRPNHSATATVPAPGGSPPPMPEPAPASVAGASAARPASGGRHRRVDDVGEHVDDLDDRLTRAPSPSTCPANAAGAPRRRCPGARPGSGRRAPLPHREHAVALLPLQPAAKLGVRERRGAVHAELLIERRVAGLHARQLQPVLGAAREPAAVPLDARVGRGVAGVAVAGVELDRRAALAQQLDDDGLAAAVRLDAAHFELAFRDDDRLGTRVVGSRCRRPRRSPADRRRPATRPRRRAARSGRCTAAARSSPTASASSPSSDSAQLDGRRLLRSRPAPAAPGRSRPGASRPCRRSARWSRTSSRRRRPRARRPPLSQRRQLEPQAVERARLHQVEAPHQRERRSPRSARRRRPAEPASAVRERARRKQQRRQHPREQQRDLAGAHQRRPALRWPRRPPPPRRDRHRRAGSRTRRRARAARPAARTAATPILSRTGAFDSANAIAVKMARNAKPTSR